jgi:hypothetical protein
MNHFNLRTIFRRNQKLFIVGFFILGFVFLIGALLIAILFGHKMYEEIQDLTIYALAFFFIGSVIEIERLNLELLQKGSR